MIGAWNYRQVCHELTNAFDRRYPKNKGNAVRMVGLLFAPPEAGLAKKEIIPSLTHFHHRSGNNIDIFCAGYGRYWRAGAVYDARNVTEDQPPWLFSSTLFRDFLDETEGMSTWEYSGEADLLLMNAIFDKNKKSASLDFTSAVACDLEQMARDKAIHGVRRFFEDMFRFAENSDSNDPTWGFSDKMGLRVAGSAFKRIILSLLPKKIGDDYKRAEHFAVRDISPRP